MLSILFTVVGFLACINGVLGTFAITGVPGATYPRYEIRTLKFNYTRQWDLYIQALQMFQNSNQTNLTSYYQISGIHGLPNVPWDGVNQTAPGVGYCVHSCNLFPTWHRPYVALFEQILQSYAVQIANTYPANARATYQQAAVKLKTPFWDWAAVPAPGLPTMAQVITNPIVMINSPSGPKNVSNPLYQYQFPAVKPPFAYPWSAWPDTLRWPTSNQTNATSQDNLAVATIENNAYGQRSALYQWFTNCADYLEMSNDEVSFSTPSCHISLESLHNNIHVWTGGTVSPQGHMTIVPYSGFEPLFMLHHCQIDRLFAMWQVIYNNSYTTNQVANITTFTIQNGSIQGPDSPLTPFHSDTVGTFWTSNTVRDTSASFHYTYPEFLNGGDTPENMRATVNTLYGPSTTGGTSKKRAVRYHHPGLRAANGSTYEYNANIATSRFGLNGTYNIFIFFSEPTNPDPTTWAYDPALVGSYGVFSQPNMENSGIVTSSLVPLTNALSQKMAIGELATLTEADVVPYLKKNIQWKVVGLGGVEYDPAEVPDFVISVVASTMAEPNTPSDFPVWSRFYTLPEVTRNKPGGFRRHSHTH